MPLAVRSSEGLGFPCEPEQRFDILFEAVSVGKAIIVLVRPAVSDARAAVRYVLPVVLLVNFPAVFSKAIDSPRTIEGRTAPPWNERAELCDSLLQGWERGA